MKTRTLIAVIIVGTASLACLCSGGSDRESGGEDTSPYSYNHDETEDTAFAEIPVMTATGSFCTVGWSTGDWEAEPGSWTGKGTGSTSTIKCIAEGGDVTFELTLEGNLENNRMVFPVESVSFAQGIVSDWIFRWSDTGGEGDFVLDGRSSNGNYVWGHFEGNIELTDSVSEEKMDLVELELVSWPHF